MTHFEMKHFQWLGVALVSAAAAAACGSDRPAVRDPGSYDQQYAAELDSERQEYIHDKQERLDELDRRIGQLEVRLQHERQYVTPSQAGEWKQDLFELQMEQRKAKAELERARTADEEEWAAMRGGFARQVDRLEASVSAFGSRIGTLFEGDDDGTPAGAWVARPSNAPCTKLDPSYAERGNVEGT
jgi:hypothetical protein